MKKPRNCPRCGVAHAPDAPEGLCPVCLSEVALLDREAPPPLGEPAGLRERLAALLPDYEVQRFLGRGGMGAVYEARQKKLDRRVALKVLVPLAEADAQWAERFEREARALARLNHPNIVGVHDFGQVDGLFYLVLEFVEGATLRELFAAGRLDPREALAIVPQICEALQYAHEEGVVHRDIKPENILLDVRGTVKIADFGLAKLVEPGAPMVTLTGSQQAMGTLRYMAPEQMDTPRAVDHRADIYSLGVVFYEMLTGTVPAGSFEPPSEIVQLDVRLDEVVLRALKRAPEQRYQKVAEFRAQLAALDATPAAPAPWARGAAAPAAAAAAAPASAARARKWSPWSTLDLPVFLSALFVLMLPDAFYEGGELIESQPYGWMLIVLFAIPVAAARHASGGGSAAHQVPRLLAPFGVLAVAMALAHGREAYVSQAGQLYVTGLGALASVLALTALWQLTHRRLGELRRRLGELRRQVASPLVLVRLRRLSVAWCALGTFGVYMPWDYQQADKGLAIAAGVLLFAYGLLRLILRGQELARLESAAGVLFGGAALGFVLVRLEQGPAFAPGPGAIVAGLSCVLLVLTSALEWWLAGGLERRAA